MAYTESNMLPLGTKAPDFMLPDVVSDKMLDLAAIAGKGATVIMFWCNHCPYVIHVTDAILAIAKEYQTRGVAFVAISSNDVEKYPQDGPGLMKELALREEYSFPYLYDATQAVAKEYDAACTPDFYVFDADLQLAYRGQMDGSRPSNGVSNDGNNLRAALDAVLDGQTPDALQRPSGGCNIKWKPA